MQALGLLEDSLGKKLESNLPINDTIVDLKNGYYELSMSWEPGGDDDTSTVCQAAIFKNANTSRLLATTVNTWDFVCVVSDTKFYDLSTSEKDHIRRLDASDLLPPLTYRDFLRSPDLLTDLEAELKPEHLRAADEYESFANYLEQVFDIRYSLPRHGTSLTAYLDVCDYFLGMEEWQYLEDKYFTKLALPYDRERGKFCKKVGFWLQPSRI